MLRGFLAWRKTSKELVGPQIERRPAARKAADDLADSPSDPAARERFALALAKALKDEPATAEQVERGFVWLASWGLLVGLPTPEPRTAPLPGLLAPTRPSLLTAKGLSTDEQLSIGQQRLLRRVEQQQQKSPGGGGVQHRMPTSGEPDVW